MKKYRVRLDRRWPGDGKIEEVEVDRETSSSVWINGNRNSKVSEWHTYFDTWEDAQRAMYQNTKQIIAMRKAQYDEACAHLMKIAAMKKP